jgi:predicted AAA+ superfamily ATPase
MLLDTLEKYYVSDTGMSNTVVGISSREDISRQIEKIVYLELLRRGYEVAVSKYGHKEVDFTARGADEIQYIQATMSMLGEDT